MGMVVRVSEGVGEQSREGVRFRMAGWAAVVAAVAFLVQPLSVGLLPFDLEEMRDPVALSAYWWAGTIQAVEFAVMAVAVLVLVVALWDVGQPTPWQRVIGALGAVSGVGFLLQSSLSAATYSWWLMQDASSFTPDPQIRTAILFGTFVAGYTFLGVANLGTAGWLLGLVLGMRRAGLAGMVLMVFAVLVATMLVAGTLSGFTIPTVLLHVPVWVVLGVKLLRAGRAVTATAGR